MNLGIIGNPNTGKSSLFNMLTGMNQKVGNFPGVTVEQKTGNFQIGDQQLNLIDFPGVYSIYPKSQDEKLVYEQLILQKETNNIETILFVLDASNVERNLFLLSQLYDLDYKILCVLNMVDLAKRKGIEIELNHLENILPGLQYVTVNARIGMGKERLMDCLRNPLESTKRKYFIENYSPSPEEDSVSQEKEAEQRYQQIQARIKNLKVNLNPKIEKKTVLDKLCTHPFLGYLLFASIMFLIFQSMFSLAQYPMEWIDSGFGWVSEGLSDSLPEGVLTDVLAQGIVPGLGGVFVFIPQIMLLFFFISILEDTGYLSRVVFIMDRIMRPLGLNGKSVVPLISSFACAIPGILSTRTIPNWKERMITIFIAPLMSCSARIPVFTLLIALVIPQKTYGIINLQGIVMFAMYFLGILGAILVAFVLKLLIKSKDRELMIIELPSFKYPRWGSIATEVMQKIKIFIFEAGKIILALSILLWALSNYGPSNRIEDEVIKYKQSKNYSTLDDYEKERNEAKLRLEHSYIGIVGKSIEPVLSPLGFDWKIGISLITSFAAREVFVGSLATIYSSSGDEENGQTLISKLKNEKLESGEKAFNFANGLSLMVFYVFAMQCMATFSVVKRETQSWKWPILQLFCFGAIAYFSSMLTFWIFSI